MTRAVHLPIFLSTTYPMNDLQSSVVESAKATLWNAELTPRFLPRTFWSLEAPLVPVRRLMRRCCGTVVLAMARTRVEKGVDFVESDEQESYEERYLSTDWAQIEAAIAFQLEHPILVFREDRIHPHGLLDPAHSGLTVRTFLPGANGIQDAMSPCLERFRERAQAFAVQRQCADAAYMRQLGT